MMPDDQGMSEEWIVRVDGKEYGPADLDTLREWKAEGRLLPANDARRANVDLWITAGEIPGLFSVTPSVEAATQLTEPPVQVSRRSFNQILAETFQIYRKGFFQFLGLVLLVLLPSICSQLITAFMQPPQGSNVDVRSVLAVGLAFLTFILSIVLWPVYIGGIQILTAEIARGQRPGLIVVLNQAVRFWPRIAALCIFVFAVFALLILFALGIALTLATGAPSLLSIFFAFALLILQVWMFGWFFITVLFWQQFAVLENAGFVDSLRESRNLARSGRDLLWHQRPSWRGALIASLWFAFVLAVSLASEWTTLNHYLNQLLTTQDPQTLLKQLTEAQQACGFDIFAFVLNVLQKVLQPLLGIAFVVLYLDSTSQLPSHVKPVIGAAERDTVR
jgi:GYF domain 2